MLQAVHRGVPHLQAGQYHFPILDSSFVEQGCKEYRGPAGHHGECICHSHRSCTGGEESERLVLFRAELFIAAQEENERALEKAAKEKEAAKKQQQQQATKKTKMPVAIDSDEGEAEAPSATAVAAAAPVEELKLTLDGKEVGDDDGDNDVLQHQEQRRCAAADDDAAVEGIVRLQRQQLDMAALQVSSALLIDAPSSYKGL